MRIAINCRIEDPQKLYNIIDQIQLQNLMILNRDSEVPSHFSCVK